MTHDYMLGYMQALRQQPLCIYNDDCADEHRAGYIKGRDMYAGDVLMHKRFLK